MTTTLPPPKLQYMRFSEPTCEVFSHFFFNSNSSYCFLYKSFVLFIFIIFNICLEISKLKNVSTCWNINCGFFLMSSNENDMKFSGLIARHKKWIKIKKLSKIMETCASFLLVHFKFFSFQSNIKWHWHIKKDGILALRYRVLFRILFENIKWKSNDI